MSSYLLLCRRDFTMLSSSWAQQIFLTPFNCVSCFFIPEVHLEKWVPGRGWQQREAECLGWVYSCLGSAIAFNFFQFWDPSSTKHYGNPCHGHLDTPCINLTHYSNRISCPLSRTRAAGVEVSGFGVTCFHCISQFKHLGGLLCMAAMSGQLWTATVRETA